MSFDQSVNRFRTARGRVLSAQIQSLTQLFGRKIAILDIGGRPDYWKNVDITGVSHIELVNMSDDELRMDSSSGFPDDLFSARCADGRDLSSWPDKSMDLVHSNSVIEHVGGWDDMASMASEAVRVGKSGWIQTPAWEFPIEPHFHVPLMHWLGNPLSRRMLSLSPFSYYRKASVTDRRKLIESINLLSRREVGVLFPGCDVYVERLLLPKSFSVRWMPEGSG
jgi:hypothetical protein